MRFHFTLVTLKGQCQDHLDFEALYLVKEQSVRLYVTISYF